MSQNSCLKLGFNSKQKELEWIYDEIHYQLISVHILSKTMHLLIILRNVYKAFPPPSSSKIAMIQWKGKMPEITSFIFLFAYPFDFVQFCF